jgi:hypothetical protein
VRQITGNDRETVWVENHDKDRITITYSNKDATDSAGMGKSELVGVHVFTTLSMSTPIGVALNLLLVKRFGESPPAIEHTEHLNGRVAITLSEDKQSLSFVFMRPVRAEDKDSEGTFLGATIRRGTSDGAPAVQIILTKASARAIRLSFADAAWRDIIMTALDKAEAQGSSGDPPAP